MIRPFGAKAARKQVRMPTGPAALGQRRVDHPQGVPPQPRPYGIRDSPFGGSLWNPAVHCYHPWTVGRYD